MSVSIINKIDASIIAVMVNWNGKEYLQASLSSLLSELDLYNGKLLLVDNHSSDGSIDYVLKNYPEVTILQTGENLGGAGGFSAGMRLAVRSPKCQYVWLLDNDIVVERNALQPLIECLRKNPTNGAAGSQICLYYQPEVIQEIGAHYSPWLGSLRLCFSGNKRLEPTFPPYTVDYLAACSVLIKRECLQDVGNFGDFFIFYDDVEWGLRAQSKGWSLWGVPASVIRHNFSSTKPTVAWREYYRKRNRLTVLSFYPPSRGGYFACILNLLNLNFLVLSNMWRGYASLYNAYLLAREDALQGKLGKRDLSYLNEYESNELILETLSNYSDIMIDIGESPGDAILLIQKLRQNNSTVNLYLPSYLKNYLIFIQSESIYISNNKKYSMVILGREFRLSSILKSNKLFIYKNGQLVSYSHWQCIKEKAIKLIAVIASILVLPYFSWLWFKSFKGGILRIDSYLTK